MEAEDRSCGAGDGPSLKKVDMNGWGMKKRDAELERELCFDLELEEEEQHENGLPPEVAQYAARRSFGNAALIKEQTRETWGWMPLERSAQDIRYALRQL